MEDPFPRAVFWAPSLHSMEVVDQFYRNYFESQKKRPADSEGDCHGETLWSPVGTNEFLKLATHGDAKLFP
jgi:hypothetical protein